MSENLNFVIDEKNSTIAIPNECGVVEINSLPFDLKSIYDYCIIGGSRNRIYFILRKSKSSEELNICQIYCSSTGVIEPFHVELNNFHYDCGWNTIHGKNILIRPFKHELEGHCKLVSMKQQGL